MSENLNRISYTTRQQEAIETTDHNLQIIACAGSGKTQVISERIVRILQKNGVTPSSILAFTFTEKAAAELKNRVLRITRQRIQNGIQGMAELFIGTIHAWCLRMLQDHAYEFQKYSILDDVKLKLFVDRKYKEIGMRELNLERYKDTDYFITAMSILRESELRSDVELPANLTEAREQYEKTLQESAYFDFTMVLTETVRRLQTDPEFAGRVCSDLRYLIVDEYQDVNPIQERLIRALYDAAKGLNLCVVGDDDQTIYQWRGSQIRNIIDFANRYDGVRSIKLEENFRSSAGIIDVAMRAIRNNQERLPKEMRDTEAQTYEKGDILYNSFENEEAENEFIVRTIRKLRGTALKEKGFVRGLDYSDFCLLFRKWSKATTVVETLRREGIPFIVTGVNELFETTEVRAARSIFEFLSNQIDESVIEDLWREAGVDTERTSLHAAIQELKKIRRRLEATEPKKKLSYDRFVLQAVYQDFLKTSGITEEVFFDSDTDEDEHTNSRAEIAFYNLGQFSHVIGDYEQINFKSKPPLKLSFFMSFLRYAAENYYPEGWLNNSYRTPNAVQLMSIHQSKGLEFPVVFLPGLNRNYLPSKKHGGKSVWHVLDRNLVVDQERYEVSEEDERRLFYVALTRAQKFLFLSRAPLNNRLYQRESAFYNEISHSDFLFSNPDRDYSDRDRSHPVPRVNTNKIILNFSVLRDYFECPYRFKLISMYGFESPLNVQVGYGRSIHSVLMELHRRGLDGEQFTNEDLAPLLDKHFHLPHAFEEALADSRKNAQRITEQYLELRQPSFQEIEYVEKDIELDLNEDIVINGRIDLVRRQNQDGSAEITIIDFKSKLHENNPKITMEQLSLYAMGYAELTGRNADFLEIYDMDRNQPTREELQAGRLRDTRELIENTVDKIRGNEFPHATEKSRCESCYYSRVCSKPATLS